MANFCYALCQTLFTASKLGVFDILSDSEGLTLEEVSNQIKASVLGTERLLEAAVSLGLLHRHSHGEKTGKSVFWLFIEIEILLHSCIICKHLQPNKEKHYIHFICSLYVEPLLMCTKGWLWKLPCVPCLTQCTGTLNRPVASWYQTALYLCTVTSSTAMTLSGPCSPT